MAQMRAFATNTDQFPQSLGFGIQKRGRQQHFVSSPYGTWTHPPPRGCTVRTETFMIPDSDELDTLCVPGTQVRYKLQVNSASPGSANARRRRLGLFYFGVWRDGNLINIVRGRSVIIEITNAPRGAWIEYTGIVAMHEGRGRCSAARGSRPAAVAGGSQAWWGGR